MTNLDKSIEISESPAQYGIPFNDESINGKNTNKETIIRLQRYNAAIVMAQWKDEQFEEEKKELRGLVDMLPINENNQTIIEDLKTMLR